MLKNKLPQFFVFVFFSMFGLCRKKNNIIVNGLALANLRNAPLVIPDLMRRKCTYSPLGASWLFYAQRYLGKSRPFVNYWVSRMNGEWSFEILIKRIKVLKILQSYILYIATKAECSSEYFQTTIGTARANTTENPSTCCGRFQTIV